MKKVLVTGATGFIGDYVVKKLLDLKHTVIASSGSKETAQTKEWFNQVTYLPLDFANIREEVDYYQYFRKPDLLIHLTWEGLPNYKDDFHIQQNLPRHKKFLQNIISNGLNDITVTGTCFEYGLKEGELDESMSASPITKYGEAKNLLRVYLEELQKSRKFRFKWVRLFYMYGKGQNPKSLLSQLDTAIEQGAEVFNMSGGEQTRDFLPVNEVAKDIVGIALQNRVTGIINCSSNDPITVKDFVIKHLSKKNSQIKLNLGFYPYPDFEPMHFWGNNKKLKTIKIDE